MCFIQMLSIHMVTSSNFVSHDLKIRAYSNYNFKAQSLFNFPNVVALSGISHADISKFN
jgi:hypothetical protein